LVNEARQCRPHAEGCCVVIIEAKHPVRGDVDAGVLGGAFTYLGPSWGRRPKTDRGLRDAPRFLGRPGKLCLPTVSGRLLLHNRASLTSVVSDLD
jgi:hypothetical protein